MTTANPADTGPDTNEELTYEGFAKFADDTVVSLQCYDGRHAECPQEEDAQGEPLNTPLDDGNYCCECSGCTHEPDAEDEEAQP